ncbi:hypothetical protein JHK85_010977 [Glycine max]|nr:hypothetical protein JHK85_010977 [Glycine max]
MVRFCGAVWTGAYPLSAVVWRAQRTCNCKWMNDRNDNDTSKTHFLFSSSSFRKPSGIANSAKKENEIACDDVVLAPPPMTTNSDSSSAPLHWKFSQVLGQRLPNEPLQNDDIITAVAFEKRGDYLAVGDRGGRVVIFERDDRKKNARNDRRELEQRDFATSRHPEFRFKTEFQSHEPEACSSVQFANLIKVKEHKVKQVKEMAPPLCSENMLLAERSFVPGLETTANGYHLEWIEKTPKNHLLPQDIDGEIGGMEDPIRAKCQKVYAYAHSFNINSISNNSDYETFISADDLRINLWNLEVSDQCFNIIDMKPSNMEDLTEVITAAEFHPLHCNLLAYSSSQGFIRLSDLRQAAICDHASRMFQHGESSGSKSFFTEITSSISDIKFLNDGQHLISRNYMNMKLWDMRMESSPVAIFKIHEHLRPKLPELYNNDCIFDKFECCFSGDGLHFATGSYRKVIHQAKSRVRRPSLSNLIPPHTDSESSRADFSCNLSSKLLHVAWHPTCNLVVCAAESSLVLYYA